MLRNQATPTSSGQTPVTHAQLRAAVEQEEVRQGLAPEGLVSDVALDEAARRLGMTPDVLRQRAQSMPSAAMAVRRSSNPASFWSAHSRKLLTAGLVLALAITALDGWLRLAPALQKQRANQTSYWQTSSTHLLPADARFRELLAKTVGPNPTLGIVAHRIDSGILTKDTSATQDEVFPLEGVPDGYELYARSLYIPDLLGNGSQRVGVSFLPMETLRAQQAKIDSSTSDEGIQPWQLVRRGTEWYVRAWAAADARSVTSGGPYARWTLHPRAQAGLKELALPASQFQVTRNEPSGAYLTFLPQQFQPDPALVKELQQRSDFRTEVPGETQYGSSELSEFRMAHFSSSSVLREVSQLEQGKAFPVPHRMLALLENGRKAYTNGREREAVRRIDLRPELAGEWKVVRYGKTLYLRGWIAGPVRTEALIGKNLVVYPTPEAPQTGYQPTKITLPMSSFSPESAAVAFLKVKLDSHAWEKW